MGVGGGVVGRWFRRKSLFTSGIPSTRGFFLRRHKVLGPMYITRYFESRKIQTKGVLRMVLPWHTITIGR